MLFQRINRSDPEKVFIVVKNSYSTATLTNGQAVTWDWTNDANGVSVSIPTATVDVCGGTDAAGVVAESIAHNSYGLIQVYGYHSAAKVRTMTATGHVYHEAQIAVAAGTRLAIGITAALVMEGIQITHTSDESSYNIDSAGFSFAAQATHTSVATAVFIKCL